jgi:hypothetical protein
VTHDAAGPFEVALLAEEVGLEFHHRHSLGETGRSVFRPKAEKAEEKVGIGWRWAEIKELAQYISTSSGV